MSWNDQEECHEQKTNENGALCFSQCAKLDNNASSSSFIRKVQSFECVRVWASSSPKAAASPPHICEKYGEEHATSIDNEYASTCVIGEASKRTDAKSGSIEIVWRRSTGVLGNNKASKYSKKIVGTDMLLGSHGQLSSLIHSSPTASSKDVTKLPVVNSDREAIVAGGKAALVSDLTSSLRALQDSRSSDHLSTERGSNGNGWVLGYLSIIVLLFVSCANFMMNVMDSKQHQWLNGSMAIIESNGISDNGGIGRAGDSPSLAVKMNAKLGPAAIQSIAEALGPILPFVGGNDLRRVVDNDEEHSTMWERFQPNFWTGAWQNRCYDVLTDNIIANSLAKMYGTPAYTNQVEGTHIDGITKNRSSDIPRGGGQAERTKRLAKPPNRATVISAAEPFVAAVNIGEMTLSDVTDVFRYAMNANRPGFNEGAFLDGLRTEMRKIISLTKEAVAMSRGGHSVLPAKTQYSPLSGQFFSHDGNDGNNSDQTTNSYGDIDALQFCAAMRIFAEWRVLRQVPEGYKGYAVGMGLGHKDVVQNLVKVETAVFAWIEERKEMLRLRPQEVLDGSDGSQEDESGLLRSPTLRQLLREEIDLRMHARLPRLREKSAAMGLLWVRRQLHYQSRIFANIYAGNYATTNLAVAAAYRQVYDQFHGWAVQKIFNYSFQAAPPPEEIYRTMNPGHLNAVLEKAKSEEREEDDKEQSNSSERNSGVDETREERGMCEGGTMEENGADSAESTGRLCQDENNLGDEGVESCSVEMEGVRNETACNGKKGNGRCQKDENALEKIGNHIACEWNKLARHIGCEWRKLTINVQRLLKIEEIKGNLGKSKLEYGVGGASSVSRGMKKKRGLSGEELERYVNEKMFFSANREFGYHLEAVEPLLEDLANLFADMNMDDPTKV